MTAARRIVVAGLLALALVVSHALYRAWPAWFGTELRLPFSTYQVGPSDLGYVGIDLPAERLQLDPAGKGSPLDSFQVVRGIGIGSDSASIRRLRGRLLFVQFKSMQPVSLCDTPVAGVTNVAGRVTRVEADGRLWLNFGSHQLPAPPEVAARARPLGMVREPNRRPEVKYRPPDPDTLAIFRVLPSGRAALVRATYEGK